MELIDYLHVLRRRAVLMTVVVIACLAGAVAATLLQTKVYTAGTTLIVNGSSKTSALDEIAKRQLATDRATAFAQIAATGLALTAAVAQANLVNGPFHPSGSVTASASANGNDPFISIKVKGTNPKQVQAVANAYVTVLPKVLKQLNQAPPAVPEDLVVLQPAGLPSSPTSPKPVKNGLIGLAIGVALALLAAFVREALDRRLRDSEEVERATRIAVLGVIPSELPKARTPITTDPNSARAEAYRKVRTNLTFSSADGIPRSLLITSAVSGEGKTTLAINLALACAKTGQRVALVEADMRRPMIADYLKLPVRKGLADVIAGKVAIADVLIPYDHGQIDILLAGTVPANPSELLGSLQMRDLMDPLLDAYDVVIIDAPPVLPVADALVIASRVDGVVLVAKIGDTTRQRLLSARDAVRKVHGHIVGIVPNAVIAKEDSAYAYAYRDRAHGQPDYLSYGVGSTDDLGADVKPDGNFDEPEPQEPAASEVEYDEPTSASRHPLRATRNAAGQGPTKRNSAEPLATDAGTADRW